MATEVVINREQLTSLPGAPPSLGLLVGLTLRDVTTAGSGSVCEVTTVTGYCACAESGHTPLPGLRCLGLSTPDWERTKELVAQHFPVGCEGCGVWVRGEGKAATLEGVEQVMKIVWARTDLNTIFKGGPILVVVMAAISDQSDCSEWCCQFDVGSLTLEPCGCVSESKDVDDYLQTKTAILRLQASLALSIPTNTGDSSEDNSFSSLTERIKSSSSVFYLPSHSQLVHTNSSRTATLATALSPGGKGEVCRLSWQNPIPVELLENITMETADNLPTAPVIRFEPGNLESGGVLQLELPLDLVCVFGLQTPLAQLTEEMKEGVCAQIKAIAHAMHWQEGPPCSVSVRHLPLPTQHVPVTVVTPCVHPREEEVEEEGLKPLRRHWHRVFGLPEDRPFFRATNRQFFTSPQGPHLISPHSAVRQSRVSGKTLAMVQGHYVYHHYMEDSFNDNGWGCAYRSLQTLCSWFALQGYTRRPVPTHREIQQVLVDVGDKEPSLIGSKEWIGSFEVSTCLNQLLGVESKIHHCSSGAAMAGVGRVLVQHFQAQGTPVMIGGGVLAHTILGVEFSESTGEIRFLILDPHYTGRNDLKTVIDKGWCGWKPVNFWDQQAHYNLCMPQRPAAI